ncbi:unnamed protein product [Blepharisma stoltei]|uniref:Ribosomal protein L20 n=1 Tax=Blepharisma stoltei TaxID=1481888 RepID=A0AAU9JP66_9CILI|nr:unnamed protein product [Blepharisma stoltei]
MNRLWKNKRTQVKQNSIAITKANEKSLIFIMGIWLKQSQSQQKCRNTFLQRIQCRGLYRSHCIIKL